MNILVANDDGINARGIHELVSALSKEATVYVSAPNVQKSAAGHGISVSQPICVSEVDFKDAEKAFEVSGTPADCVKIGLRILNQLSIKIDMIFSGINHGGNLGTDTLYSGTVAAAIEGNLSGYPSVAVSVNDHNPSHFDYACDLAVRTLKASFGKLGTKTTLSLNIPNLPYKDVRGVKISPLGPREYEEWFHPKEDADGKRRFTYSGKPVKYTDLPEELDVMAIGDGYAVITPLQFDLTDYKLIEEVKDWRI